MKNTLKRLLLLTLACVLTLGMFASAFAEETTEYIVDYTKYPEDFSAWTLAEVKGYLKDAGIFTNDKFLLMDLTEGDLNAMKADAGTMYMDTDAGTVFDMVMVFNTEIPESADMLASVIENQAIVADGDVENGVAMDAVVGHVCFSYLNGYDDDHINAFIQAIKDLAAHFEMEPAYIIE